MHSTAKVKFEATLSEYSSYGQSDEAKKVRKLCEAHGSHVARPAGEGHGFLQLLQGLLLLHLLLLQPLYQLQLHTTLQAS